MSSKNFSYKNFYPLVDPDDIFFILSEDDETNNQDPLSYNNKNDDDNNKGTPSQPSEPLSETMRDIYLLDQPSKRALVHYLKNPLSERTSNLEETVQTSHSENALQSSSSKKIISKVLELA